MSTSPQTCEPEAATVAAAPQFRNDGWKSALTAAYREWSRHLDGLRYAAQSLCHQYPGHDEVKMFAADCYRVSGDFNSALEIYEELRHRAPRNELCRIEQAIAICSSDCPYFPAPFEQQLSQGLFATGENARTWRRYARSDVQRGRRLVQLLRQHVPLKGQRVLDVGSGWGGMMIALAEEGATTVGIEYDTERVAVCRDRLHSVDMSVDMNEGDACDPGVRQRLGEFDVVICQDVLEHVLDPATVIASMCAMLKPGGVLYAQVPNKWGFGQLVADHHFALPGLTALARKQSREYWAAVSGRDPRSYDVGFLKSSKWYRNVFRRHGVQMTVLDTGANLDDVLAYMGEFEMLGKCLRDPFPGAIRPQLERRIHARILNVARLYGKACKGIQLLGTTSPEVAANLSTEVIERLCLSLWRFLGKKTAA